MLTPAQVAETYFLESRHQLLEIAAYLDRYDAAVARSGAAAAMVDARFDAAGAPLPLIIVDDTLFALDIVSGFCK